MFSISPLASLANNITAWQPVTSLPDIRLELTAATNGNHIFVIGGASGYPVHSDVYAATIHPNGTLGTWTTTTSLPSERISHTSVISKGHLYVIGGYRRPFDPGGGQATVFGASILSEGTLGAWSTLTPLPTDLYRSAAVAYGDWIYVIGGFSDSWGTVQSLVLRAEVQSDGTLSDWINLPELPTQLHGHSAVVVGSHIFVLGGLGSTAVYETTINSDGSIDDWRLSTSLPIPIGAMGAVVIKNRIVLAGGRTGSGADIDISDVYVGNVEPNGNISGWQANQNLPLPVSHFGMVASGNYVYSMGGISNENILNTAYSARFVSSAVAPPIATGFQWPYSWPMKITANSKYLQYGSTNSQCNGVGVHHALDLVDEGATNPPVYAVADGIVVKVGNDTRGVNGNIGFGHYVIVWHKLPDNKDVFSLYAHLLPNSVPVEELQPVYRGSTIIGQQDTSGGAGGVNHLHFELRQVRWIKQDYLCPLTEADANQYWYNPETFIPGHWWQPATHTETASAVTSIIATEVQNTAATINPNQQTNVVQTLLQGLKKLLTFSIDFPGSSLEVTIFRPNGTIYSKYLVDEPPALITIPNPGDGNWGYSIRAVEVPYADYPYAVSVGTRDEPLLNTGENNGGIPSDAFTGDVIAPTTTILFNSQNPSEIHNQPVEVSFIAEDNVDGEGVALTLYSLDGESIFQTYTEPFIMSVEGAHTIAFYSQDGVGNSETVKTNTFLIDTTPPSIPTLLSPPDQALVRSDQVSFQWGTSIDAVRYEIRMGNSNPPSSLVESTIKTTYVPAYPLIPRTYFWQVRAFDEAGNPSDWTASRSVTIFSSPNASPPRDYYTTLTPTFTWNQVGWASSYEVQVGNNLSFTDATTYQVSNSLELTLPLLLTNGLYYWRVRACSSVTNCQAWSVGNAFIVDVP